MKKNKLISAMLSILLALFIYVPATATESPSTNQTKNNTDNATYHDDADHDDAEVLAYIKKMKSDPQVKQIVEEDAVNPQSWWRWFDSLPVESVSSINQKEAMEWLENYMTFSKEERNMFNYNLLQINILDPTISILDAPEGNLGINPFANEINPGGTFLPVGGSEHVFLPSFWNRDDIYPYANCYLYSLNTYGGQADYLGIVGFQSQRPTIPSIQQIYNNFDKYLTEDAKYFNNKTIVKTTASAKPGYGQYKIVGVMHKDVDYHFYRQDSDGYWSHKRGYDGYISQYDASGLKIINPSTCNRNYSTTNGANYSSFMGYYMVTYKQ